MDKYIRINENLKKQLKILAAQKGTSIKSLAENYIQQGVKIKEEKKMKKLSKNEMEKFLEKHIDEKALADFSIAPFGEYFGLYQDGSYSTGQSIGMEIDPEERPLVAIGVPGIGNIDTNFWLEGWTHENDEREIVVDETGETIDLAEAIRRCCQDGDVSDELEGFRKELLNAYCEE
jgi:hypothetical protein